MGDWGFTCPTRRVFNTQERHDENPEIWLYLFDQLWSFPVSFFFLFDNFELILWGFLML